MEEKTSPTSLHSDNKHVVVLVQLLSGNYDISRKMLLTIETDALLITSTNERSLTSFPMRHETVSTVVLFSSGSYRIGAGDEDDFRIDAGTREVAWARPEQRSCSPVAGFIGRRRLALPEPLS